MGSRGRIVSVGECMVELSPGNGGEFKLGFAGDTFNTAWYLRSRLKEDWQVDYFTSVGDDFYSAQMLDFMARNGIGTSRIRTIRNRRPGLYIIRQADGDRHFTYWRGESAARQFADDGPHLSQTLAGAGLIYFSGISLAILTRENRGRYLQAIGEAAKAGAKIAFDPNERPALWQSPDEMRAEITAAATLADYCFPTLSDEVQHFGDKSAQDVAERYLKLGVGEVVVKNGSKAALVASGGRHFDVAPQREISAIDPTGAGDSFNGSYLAARINGASAKEAAASGHETASIVIMHQGALVPMQELKAQPTS